MALSAIIIIIFIISAPKYSNILIDNKIKGLSLSELYPRIARCLITRRIYNAFRRFVTRSVMPISTDMVNKITVISGKEVTAIFRRVSSYRCGWFRRATAISENWSVYGAFPGWLLCHEKYSWQSNKRAIKSTWYMMMIEITNKLYNTG